MEQGKFTEHFELKEDLGKWVTFGLRFVTFFPGAIISLIVCRGAFSVVKKCIDIKTKTEYAAKIFNTKRLSTRGELLLSSCVSGFTHTV